MANIYDRDNNTFSHIGVPFNYTRGNPLPLDNSSVWNSLSAAEEYAKTSPVSYVGQILTVKEGTTFTAYIIENAAGNLKALASGGDASSLQTALNNEISTRSSADAFLSGTIDNILSSTLPTLSGDINTHLSTTLSIEVNAAETADEGFLSTYVIKQGGAEVGKVNIPKDKVVSNAEVVEDPEGKEPGTYIKLTIANSDPIYVAVPTLVNTYAGVDSDTIDLDVYNDETGAYKISAIVKTGSVGAEHLTNDLSNAISTVIAREAADRTAIEALSGDGEGSVKKQIEALSTALSGEIDTLSTALSTEISAEAIRAKGVEETLSNAISSKVKVGDYGKELSAIDTLSVVHIDQDTYHNLVKEEKIDPTVIYIVSSDYMNLYGEKIVNLADGTDLSDAVNVKQLSVVSADLEQKISQAVSGGVEQLSSKVFGADGLSVELKTDITTLQGSAEDLSTATSIAGAKKYADQVVADAKVELKGTETDLSTAATIAGAKKYAEQYADLEVANVKDELISADGILSTNNTIFGAKAYADQKSTDVKTALEGTETDLSTAATIAGAKKYADEKAAEVAAIANAALSDVSTTGTGVLTALTAENNEVVGTFKSLSGTYTTTGDVNAITSITQDDYGQITSVAGVHVLSAVELVKTDAALLTGDLSVLANQYKIKVDGTELTTTIDIPKDKVIESASVVKNPEGQAEGTYIKIIVQNVADPIYVAVPTLVNTYAGVDSDTISMTVTDGTTDGYKISAEVVDGSITTDKLADEAVTPAKMSTLSSDIFIFDCGNSEYVAPTEPVEQP